MTTNSLDACCLMRRQKSRAGSSGCRCGWFKETSLSEVAHDERHGHQSDADAKWSKELVDGIGQDERAGPCCHFGANHRLAEAQFAQHGRHINPTEDTNDTGVMLGNCYTFTWSIFIKVCSSSHCVG